MRGMLGLLIAFAIQGFLIFRFITSFLKSKRESKEQNSAKQPTTKKSKTVASTNAPSKKERKKESDLPEADQNVNNAQKKLKTK